MSDFLAKLKNEYDHISKRQIGRLEPGLSPDDVISACKKTVEEMRSHRIIIDKIIKTRLNPMLDNITNISDGDEAELFETAQMISAHAMLLDPGLALKIYQSLLEKAREKNDRDKEIKYLYWCGITLYYFNNREKQKILSYFEEGASHSSRYGQIEDEDARRYVHRCLGNHHMMLFSIGETEKALALEDRIFSFWNSLMFAGVDPDFPWLNYFLTCVNHKYPYLNRQAHTDPDSATKENLEKLLDNAISAQKLYQKNESLFGVHGGTRFDYMLWEAQFLSGLISFDQLLENVYKKQETFTADDYSADAVFAKVNLFSYLMFFAVSMKELIGKESGFLAEASEKVIDYISKIPKNANSINITGQLRTFAKNMSDIFDPMEQIGFILELTTYRNIPTYAHSLMVGKIAVCLTKFLVEENPACFIGCIDLTSVDEVKKRATELYEFAEFCGLCHDIGKFKYSDNRYMFTRVLTEDEMLVVKMHPEDGFLLFAQEGDALYNGYRDIMLGHHKHYDNSGGYPESFNITESKHRMMIDIIKVADTIDAATDDVGKAYSAVKSLDGICTEIREQAGSEYSPVVAELLNKAPVISALKYILETERKEAFYIAYTHAWS